MNLQDLTFLIKTKHLGYSTPSTLYKGVEKILSYKRCIEIVNRESEYEYTSEIFTYWETSNKPLFDIIITKRKNEYTYELSSCSLFGMYWLNSNTMSIGMENVISIFNLDVPTKVDLEKYTKINYKKVMIGKDFKK